MTTPFPTVVRHARRVSVRAITSAIVLGAMLIPAAPWASAATTCQVTFSGNATGSSDVTSSLTAFIHNHGGRQLCLKANGIYRVDGIVRITSESGLRLDGQNATLRAGPSASWSNRRQLNIESGRNIVIQNLVIRGNNPNHTRWNATRQHEPGIWIDGGHGISFYNVVIRDTYGDGIYVGYKDGRLAPPTAITFTKVNIARVGRSGIAIVAGSHILITNSLISDASLHAIDLEPDFASADIHNVTVRWSLLRRYGQSGADTGYAFAANGKAGSMSYISVTGNSADRFTTTVQNHNGGTHRNIVFTGNRSTLQANAYFTNVTGLSYFGNVNIAARRSNVN
jgi:hypothetical protein